MWSLVEHQLENARALARIDKRRPRQASLRRAVSTAYYAIFQAPCATCANKLVDASKPWDVYTPVFRALEHGSTKQAFLQRSVVATVELQQFGIAFSELQAAREWADYNPEPRPNYKEGRNDAPFTRDEALRLIELAEDAIRILYQLDDETRLKLATRLVTKSRK